MKYLDEYRDGRVAQKIVDEIRRTITRPWVLMEVCGGQTHSIVRHGLDCLLPEQVELVCRAPLGDPNNYSSTAGSGLGCQKAGQHSGHN